MKSVNVTVLDNGLRIVSERIPQVESAAVGMWILSGLETESDRFLGIGHFLEHMVFKGTTRRTARQISEQIDGVGGHLNGYTDREYICLYTHLLGEDLPLGVDLLFDMALHSRFDPEDVEKEREVIIQESRRLEDNPEEQVHDFAVEAAWEGHPLGRSLHGNEKTIGAIGRDDLIAHFREHYVPDRMLVAAAGAIDHEKLVALVRAAADKLKPGAPVQPYPAPVFRSQQRRVERSTEQVHLCLALPGLSQSDKDRFALAVFDTLLGGSTSSRLFQEIRENRGLAYSIGSYAFSCRNGGLFLIHAGTSNRSFAKVMELIDQELAHLRNAGPAEHDLARVKAQVRGSLALARESSSYRMQRLAHGMIYEGRVVPYRELLRRFEAVSAPAIQHVAQRLQNVPATLVAMGPIKQSKSRKV
jgi:predicted Zn-dependent peptidase